MLLPRLFLVSPNPSDMVSTSRGFICLQESGPIPTDHKIVQA